MKKRVVMAIIAGMMITLSACTPGAGENKADTENSIFAEKEEAVETAEEASVDGDNTENEATESESTDVLNADGEESENVEETEVSGEDEYPNVIEEDEIDSFVKGVQGGSIQDEIAKIEAKSQEFENLNWDMPQQYLNYETWLWYSVWDAELNSLWSRLSDEASAKQKEQLLAGQREWIKKKEANVTEAGAQAYGGTIQAQLENSTAEAMTRARVYYLASCLAEVRGEGFEISDEIQKSLDEAEPSLDKVFDKFLGQWIFDEETGDCIRIEKAADSDINIEGAGYILSVSGGDVLSDLDVSDYTSESISFHVNRDGADSYYKVMFNMSGSIELHYGTSPDKMDDVIYCD